MQARIELLHAHDMANGTGEKTERLGGKLMRLLRFAHVVDREKLNFSVFGGENSKLALFTFSPCVEGIVQKNAIPPLLFHPPPTYSVRQKKEKERGGSTRYNEITRIKQRTQTKDRLKTA